MCEVALNRITTFNTLLYCGHFETHNRSFAAGLNYEVLLVSNSRIMKVVVLNPIIKLDSQKLWESLVKTTYLRPSQSSFVVEHVGIMIIQIRLLSMFIILSTRSHHRINTHVFLVSVLNYEARHIYHLNKCVGVQLRGFSHITVTYFISWIISHQDFSQSNKKESDLTSDLDFEIRSLITCIRCKL